MVDDVALGPTMPGEGAATPSPPTLDIVGLPLAPGTSIERYIVTGTLGAGGVGIVYAAEDPELHRRVAIKLLRSDGAGPQAQARLQREAQAMARISHPNVMPVFDVGTWNGQVFVAMELVEGENLRAWLAARERPLAEVLDVFMACGRGLAAAHAAGLVHRDFKPDNVLVGRDGRVRVTDFGLARREGELPETPSGGDERKPAPLELTLTRSGTVMGTPAYMAPEQHGGGNTDARTDQFNFCVALYEAVYRVLPFPMSSFVVLRESVLAGKVAEPPRAAGAAGSLFPIIRRGLSVRPGDRFPTMEALLGEIGRDRRRVPRRVAVVSFLLLAAVCIAIFADWIVRERVLAVARTSFAAAHAQLGRSLALRTDAFVAVSDLSYMVPAMRQVTGAVDDSDFGLGGAPDDATQLAEVHEGLRSADWISWAKQTGRADIGVADYKGRLVYASAAPETWGADVRQLEVIARAYDPDAPGQVSAAVLRGDDPALLASGVIGKQARPGLIVVFARATVLGGVPKAVFVQTLEGARLLSEVSLGGGTQLALVAPDGTAEGTVPPAVLAAGKGARGDAAEIASGGDNWLVQAYPMRALDRQSEIATIVLARKLDVGLGGLFLGARAVLGGLALLLCAAGVIAWRLARAR